MAAAQSVAAGIIDAGGQACAIQFDLTDAESTRTMIDKILEEGPIQILVNNAGVHDDAIFPGMSPEQWHRVIDVSINGFYNVTQPLVLPMIRTRWGRIISISSVTALLGNRGQVNYAAPRERSTRPPRRSASRWRAGASPSTPLRPALFPPT